MTETSSGSYTSLYEVKTLDQIPTCVLRFLTVLGPFFQKLAKLLQIITWRHSNSRYSVLIVLIWISVCLFTWELLALLPSLVLISLARDWFKLKTNKTRREQLEKKRQLDRERNLNEYDDDDDDRAKQLRLQQQKEEEEELLISRKIIPDDQVLLDDTLEDIATINECIDCFREQWRPIWNYMDGTNKAKSVSILSVLMYVWPIWFISCWLFGAHLMLCLLGTWFFISPSPQYKLIVNTMMKNKVFKHMLTSLWAYGVAFITSCVFFTPFSKKFSVKKWFLSIWQKTKIEKSKAMAVIDSIKEQEEQQQKGTRSGMVFQFEIYENQRWWLGVNWTTNMMPSEREAWTDNQLKPISSKESFHLPESTVKTVKYEKDGKTLEKTINKVWSWADGDWWVDMTGEVNGKVDHHGWEYGNNAWKQLVGSPGMQTFTRRRKWCRRAKLTEREITNENKKNK